MLHPKFVGILTGGADDGVKPEEVVQAADESGQEGRDHLIYEAADLLYHLMVLLGHHEIHIREIESELGRRFGVSGIDEKASRNS